MNALNRNRKHVIIFFISLFLLLLVHVVFFYTTSSHIPYIHAQESGSLSPTPSPVVSPSTAISDINPTTAEEFKTKNQENNYIPGEVIVKFRQDQSPSQTISGLAATQFYVENKGLADIFLKYKIDTIEPIFVRPQFLNKEQLLQIYKNNDKVVEGRLKMQEIFKSRHLEQIILIKSSDIKSKIQEEKKTPEQQIYQDQNSVKTMDSKVNLYPYTQQLLQELKQNSAVETVQFNYLYKIAQTPSDTLYSEMWNLNNTGQQYPTAYGQTTGASDADIDVPEGWIKTTKAGAGVLVAIIDSGIDYNHPDIQNNIWINPGEDVNGDGKVTATDFNGVDDDRNGYIDDVRGWDTSTCDGYNASGCYAPKLPDNDPIDEAGHGTHVAGIIVAEGNNGEGIIGIAYKSKVVGIKGFGKNETTSSTNLINAVYYALSIGAEIINCSWGTLGGNDFDLEKAFDDIYQNGVISITAAGNDIADVSNYFPAAYKSVITVSATDSNDKLATFSNFGPKIDVAAPGVDILSLRANNTDMYGDGTHIYKNNYYIASGTSMAAPQVAGIVAVMKSEHPEYGQEEIRQILRQTADDKGVSDFDDKFGYGRVNLFNILTSTTRPIYIHITSPANNYITSNTTIIAGSIEQNISWQIAYKKNEDKNWVLLAQGTGNNIKTTLDISHFSNSRYFIKVEAQSLDPSVKKSGVDIVAVDKVRAFYPYKNLAMAFNQLIFNDLDNDKQPEIIIGSYEGEELAFKQVQGWPLHTEKSIEFSAAVEDIDNDGITDIIVPNSKLASDPAWPKLYRFNAAGNKIWEKQFTDVSAISCVTLADLNNDKLSEIIIGTKEPAVYLSHLRVLDKDANELWDQSLNGVTYLPSGQSTQCATVADFLGDGNKEIIVPVYASSETESKIKVFDSKGAELFSTSTNYTPSNIVAGRFGDTDMAIYTETQSYWERHKFDYTIYALKSIGGMVSMGSIKEFKDVDYILRDLALGDMNNDGVPEIVGIGNKYSSISPYCVFGDIMIKVFDLNGVELLSKVVSSHNYCGKIGIPIIADLNNDSFPEVILMASDKGNDSSDIFALNGKDLSVLDGFPIMTHSSYSFAIGVTDLENNNKPDIIVAGEKGVIGWELNTLFNKSKMEWPMFYQNPQRTGRLSLVNKEVVLLEGDLNHDNKVDIFDIVTVAKDFGKKGEGFSGDADKNGVVDIFDLVIVAKNFGKKL